MMQNIADMEAIKSILETRFNEIPCIVYLFGSRATGKATPGSDYDLAVLSDLDIDVILSQARMDLEDSSIPQTVDLVDLRRVSEGFRERVLREGEILWRN